MPSSLCRILLPGVLLVALVGSAAAADSPAVRDDAGFFSPDTVRQANEEILALQKQFDVDLLVESVPTVPADKVKQVREMKAPERDQFFTAWALDRARAAGIRGVYVLICKDPGHLQVEVGKQTQKQAFTAANRDKLRDILLAGFKEKEHDKALLAGIAMVRETLQKNMGPTQIPLVAREVKDYAGFFSPAAVQKANAELQSLPHAPGKDVAIETFPTPPPARIPEVEKMPAAERSKYFAEWAAQRSKEGKLDGILVLICKHPGHAQVDLRGNAADKLFTPAEIDRLSKELLSRFRNHEYDQGLADTVHVLHEKLATAAGVATAPSLPVAVPAVVPTTPSQPALTPAVVPTTPIQPAKMPDTVPTPVPATGTTPPADAKGSAGAAATARTEPEKARSKVETPAHSADAATVVKDAMAKVKEKANDVAQTQFPTWMWVSGIVGGLLLLWIIVGILRALFGGGRHGSAVQAAPQQPTPSANAGYPTQGYARPPQGAGYPTSQQGGSPLPPQGGYPRPPQGGGYPQAQQGGYPMPSAPVPPRSGGGFVSSVLGGMLGGAAGSWVYDSFRGTGSSSGGSNMPLPSNPPHHPAATPTAGSPNTVSGGDGYNTGGDFDSSAAGGGAGAGGDFDSSTPTQANTGAGGDFDSSVAADTTGSGGDFDSPSPAQADASAGGDFDSQGPQATADAGGDFDAQDPQAVADDGSGGAFDASSGDDQASSGGDFGGDSGSQDVAGNDTGGDFGDSTS